MAKKLNWLDKFAEEQAAKMQKTASTTKIAEGQEVIVNPEDVPGATDGAVVQYNGENFEVVNANYSDEFGPGVVLKAAAYEGLENDPMGLSMGVAPSTFTTPSAQGQQYSYTKLDVQQTYTNDEDAQWGSSSADATEQEIAGENSIDRTTVPGHYTKSPGVNATPAAAVPGEAQTAPAVQTVPVQAPAQEPAQTEPVQDAAPAQAPSQEIQPTDVPAEGEEKEPKIANRILARIIAKQGK